MSAADRLALLTEILRRVAAESVLEGDRLGALAGALEERAQIILSESMCPLVQQVSALEGEVAWRKQTQVDLEQMLSSLKDDLQRANETHERLLTHHREVTRHLGNELTEMGALGLVRFRELRRRIRTLGEMLQQEDP